MEQIMKWLEEVMGFTWEVKKQRYAKTQQF
jgi:hypothetical protein